MELRCQPSLALPASEFGDGVGDGGQGPGKCHADIVKPPAPTGMEGPGFGEEGGGGVAGWQGLAQPFTAPSTSSRKAALAGTGNVGGRGSMIHGPALPPCTNVLILNKTDSFISDIYDRRQKSCWGKCITFQMHSCFLSITYQ